MTSVQFQQLMDQQGQKYNADYYRQNVPTAVADTQSKQLGISKDQLYQMYGAYAKQNPLSANATPWMIQGLNAGPGAASNPYMSGAYPWIQQQVNNQAAQAILNPQQQQIPQFQQSQLGPQPRPAAPTITPLTAAAQYGATNQPAAATPMNVPQANAGAALPMFSLGGGGQNWMLPQAQPEPQRFASGGPVGSANWFKQQIPQDQMQKQADAMGISTDKLYQMYSDEWMQTARQAAPASGMAYGGAGGGAGQAYTGYAGNFGYNPTTTFAAPVNVKAPTQPQQQPQPQMPQLAPAQPMPAAPQITPLAATAQYGTTTQPATTMNVPQGNAQAAAPMFSLGAGGQQSWMLPQAQTQQPIQRFAGGGQVQPSDQSLSLSSGYQTGDPNAGWNNPLFGANALGAFALGMPLIANPMPSGTPSSKSGVATVGQPVNYGYAPYTGGPITLPGGQTFSAEQVANFSPADWQEVGKVGIQRPMPASIAGGPWATQPGIFNKAPMPTVGTAQAAGWTGNPQMPLTAQTPANAAQMPQMNIQPANAGAAQPQMTIASGYTMPAGRAMPPGAPGALEASNAWGATPQPYTGTVENDPYMSRAISSLMGFKTNPWHPQAPPGGAPQMQAGALQGAAPSPQGIAAEIALGTRGPAAAAPARKMAYGGVVPGRGNQDSVPALLTPGEYVLPKPLATQFMAGQPIRRMAGGGAVVDDSGDTNQQRLPAEARRRTLSADQTQQTQQSFQGSPYQPAPSNQAAATTVNNLANNLSKLYGQGGPSGFSGLGSGAYSGGGGTTVGDVMGGAAVPNAGQTLSLGQAPGMGGVTPNQAGAIAGAGQQIAQYAQQAAASVKPWQMQKQAFGGNIPTYRTPQLQQEQET